MNKSDWKKFFEERVNRCKVLIVGDVTITNFNTKNFVRSKLASAGFYFEDCVNRCKVLIVVDVTITNFNTKNFV